LFGWKEARDWAAQDQTGAGAFSEMLTDFRRKK
jgi:hypothetical protein